MPNKLHKQFVKELRSYGFYKVRQKGSHSTYTNGKKNITVNENLNRMVMQRLRKELKNEN